MVKGNIGLDKYHHLLLLQQTSMIYKPLDYEIKMFPKGKKLLPLYTDSCEHQVVGSTLSCIFSNNSLLILPLQDEMTSQYKNYFPRVKYKAIFPCSKFPHENASRFKLPFNLSLLPQLVVAHMAASSILRGHLPDSSFSGKIGAVLPES